MVVEYRRSEDSSVSVVSRSKDLASRIRRGARQLFVEREFQRYRGSRPPGVELFSDDRTEYVTLPAQLPDCDVVNLHWITGFVDYASFFAAIPAGRPSVWTLHDMNAFTGGCHYNIGCERFRESCGACPQLGSSDPSDLSSRIWNRKKAALSRVNGGRLSVVAPSRWLAAEAARSSILAGFPIQVIPYGLDVSATFVPRDKEPIRDALGIPRNARVVLFVAERTDSPRKGMTLLLDALRRASAAVPDLFLLSLGSRKPEASIPVPWLHLGALDNDRFLAMVYSAADIFAICSMQDNLPNTVLEAMACGLPVIGTDVGGIPDMVRTGVNGYTAPVSDTTAFAEAVIRVLGDPGLSAQMGDSSRKIAVDEYPLELQARRYADLYRQLSDGEASAG
jgi:glycosyltransferase involved in cell wall biosynthesis